MSYKKGKNDIAGHGVACAKKVLIGLGVASSVFVLALYGPTAFAAMGDICAALWCGTINLLTNDGSAFWPPFALEVFCVALFAWTLCVLRSMDKTERTMYRVIFVTIACVAFALLVPSVAAVASFVSGPIGDSRLSRPQLIAEGFTFLVAASPAFCLLQGVFKITEIFARND
jgi:uncharacterized membrane protein